MGLKRVITQDACPFSLIDSFNALDQLLPVDVPQLLRVGLQHRAHVMGHGLLLCFGPQSPGYITGEHLLLRVYFMYTFCEE